MVEFCPYASSTDRYTGHMLSAQQKQEIEVAVARYAEKRAVVPEALKIVQQQRGWVADADVRDVAEFLRMTPAEVDAIATFYSMIYRQPVGRHVILLCDSVSCWIMGFHPIREQLATRLGITFGETTPDHRFTLLPTACLGACDHAPAMMIDDDLYIDLTTDAIDEILARYQV